MRQKNYVSVPFMLMGILFNVCLITANLLALKLLQIGPIVVTAGLLVFPISYIINDCIVEVWGYRKARLIIWSGFSMNFFVVILGLLAVHLPSAPFWDGQEHFNYVFNLAPRVAAASLISYVVGSFLNAYVMSKMKVAENGKHFWLRAIVSTLVGESGDSLFFFPIAFWGLIPTNEVFKLMLVQIILKTLYEVVALPITTYVVKLLKKVDGEDVYDTNISYNILKLRDM